MINTFKVNRKVAQPILNASFPEYHGRKISVKVTDKITFYDCNWSGGTKNEYAAICADGRKETMYTPAPWNNPFEGQTVDMSPSVIVIEHSHFCGKDCGITIYIHPDLAPKYLPYAEVTPC